MLTVENTPWTATFDDDEWGLWSVIDCKGELVFFGMNEAVAKLLAAAPDLLEQTKLLERSLLYQISVNSSDGDDEGARLKTGTLHFVRKAIAKAVEPAAKRGTYARKIGEGQFEYGWYVEPQNFRKQSTRYEPVGVESTVAAAEAKRAALLAA